MDIDLNDKEILLGTMASLWAMGLTISFLTFQPEGMPFWAWVVRRGSQPRTLSASQLRVDRGGTNLKHPCTAIFFLNRRIRGSEWERDVPDPLKPTKGGVEAAAQTSCGCLLTPGLTFSKDILNMYTSENYPFIQMKVCILATNSLTKWKSKHLSCNLNIYGTSKLL